MIWIKQIVDGLIEMYGTRDVYELLNYLEVTLIRKKLFKNEKGRFFRDMFGNESIFISNDLSDKEEKVVIAHELGHLILHTDLSTSSYTENHLLSKGRIETQADKFAAELLIPDDVEIHEGITIQQLACYLGVPEELVKLKFRKEF
ncbi:ImmA/IrrE family metallo-endopeptidase [Clostridium sp.]|uniref:ImmA/IrrE family metallo-endopeptidase n=1 Tax=Clostridium sp. TaxID=1506 RepID=UPI003A3EBCFE